MTEKAEMTDAPERPTNAEPTLQVVVAYDGDGWTSQAVELDYAASGEDPEDAKTRFLIGLEATAEAQLAAVGNISALKKPARPEDWARLLVEGFTRTLMMTIERRPLDLRRHGLEQRTVAFIVTVG